MSTLNSSFSCFMCYQSIGSTSVSSERSQVDHSNNDRKCHRFLVLISRYLNLNTDFLDVGKTLNTNLKEGRHDSDNWQLCEDCFPELDAFCDMYDLLQHLHLEMNKKLESISENMRRGAMRNRQGIANSYQTTMPEDFKIAILKQVAKKNGESFPQLKLQDVQNPTMSCLKPSDDVKDLLKEESAAPMDLTNEENILFEPNAVMDITTMSSDDGDITFGPDFLLSDFYSSLLKCELSEVTPDEHPKPIKEKIGHKCTTCSKVFAKSYNLRRHMAIHTHTGLQDFACPLCFKRFCSKWSLKQHHLKHINGGPFACDKCEKRYFQKWTLKQHLRTHEDEQPSADSVENGSVRNSY